MRIYTPMEAAREAGNKYLGVLVAAKFSRFLNDLPKEKVTEKEEKLTTVALDKLCDGDLEYKLLRRRRSQA